MADAVPPPVRRIEVEALLAAVNERTGTDLRLLGRSGQGEVGAGFVAWPNGCPAVLTRSGAPKAELLETAGVLDELRKRGLPVPHYQLIPDLGEDRVIIQQRLPGGPPTMINTELVSELILLLEQCAGLGGLPGLEPIELYLTRSGPGFCLHESLLASDHRSRRLLDRIREIGAEPDQPAADDLVHLDFHPGNVLTEDGRISGWVDWDGFGRGDRRFALVTCLFDLGNGRRFRDGYRDLEDAALESVLTGLSTALPDQVRRWWAHMSLRQVDWTIRHDYPAEQVDYYLRLASLGLDRLESGRLPSAAEV